MFGSVAHGSSVLSVVVGSWGFCLVMGLMGVVFGSWACGSCVCLWGSWVLCFLEWG